MPDVFGADTSALRERVGMLSQVVRVDSFVEAEGNARGARRLRVINGGGIEFEIHPDRALDIGHITVGGVPIAWMSPTGIASPAFREPEGLGWLRTFGGGLLATCGLDTFGPPSEDDGQVLGQHGRIGTMSAHVTHAEATWEGVVVEGTVRQATVFGENLVLHRRIFTAAGSDTITVDDTVTNEGFIPNPHMVLYHVNLGWPLLDEGTVVDIPSSSVAARDSAATEGLAALGEIGAPTPGFQEQVFMHRFDDNSEGNNLTLNVTNERLGLAFGLSFDRATLPYLHEWKMQGQGHYVLGVEPSNTDVPIGRAAARAAGALPMLAPGESVTHHLIFRLRRTA